MCFKGDETFSPEKRIEGVHDNLFICIPPPYNDISFECGLWDFVNSRCGTMFDLYEEDSISGESCLTVAMAIRDFLEGRPINPKKAIESDFYSWMGLLIKFLVQCSEEQKEAELWL